MDISPNYKMIEIMLKWYFIPPLIIMAISWFTYGRKQNWPFVKILLTTILAVVVFYMGLVIGENILRVYL